MCSSDLGGVRKGDIEPPVKIGGQSRSGYHLQSFGKNPLTFDIVLAGLASSKMGLDQGGVMLIQLTIRIARQPILDFGVQVGPFVGVCVFEIAHEDSPMCILCGW